MSVPTTTVTKTDVLAGPAQLFVGLANGVVWPLPAEINSSPTLSGGWKDVGATSGGLTTTVTQTMFQMFVDQVPDLLGNRVTQRIVAVNTSLAQATLDNMAYAVNASPPLSGTGYSKRLDLTPGQPAMFPVDLAIIVDGYAPGTNKKRRFWARIVNSIEAVASAQTKDGLVLIPVTFNALYVDSTTSPATWIDE